jgi:integrase
MAKKINFTIATIKSLPEVKNGARDYYYDLKTPGLGIMVFSSGTKTFFLYKRVDGKPDKIKLGRFPDLSIEQARKLAIAGMNDIANGINPNKTKQILRVELSFGDLFQKFLHEHAKERKKSWKNDESYYNCHLKTLEKRKLSTITRADFEKLHNSIKSKSGIYSANRSLSLANTMFSKAIDWGYIAHNPVDRIKKFQETARDRALQPEELEKFFDALSSEPNYIFRNYFYISLLTGARKRNVFAMRWDQLNLGTNPEWLIPETKNGEPLVVSLVPQAVAILNDIKSYHESNWVFPSSYSKSGHIEEPKKIWKTILNRAGITNLRIHDLRRTMASWQVRTGANSFIIGKTLGHKSQQATAIYARVSKDVARESMENAVNAMFEYKK